MTDGTHDYHGMYAEQREGDVETCDYCDEVHEQPEQFCCVCGNELPPTYSAGRHAHGCYKTMECGGEDR